jgi:glycosyltransferase involved in cell wall biosynthesis
MKPLVSILIPAYNAERWIADTLRSAIAQTWPRTEIIIVDDGSKDRTLAVARQFESKNISVVRQENQGSSAARNTAFSLSQGDYIQWLDADDLLAPDKIARQMEVLRGRCSDRTLLSSGWGWFMHRYYRAEFVPSPLWCDLSPAEWLLRKMEHNAHMQPATWLVSRALTEAAGPWDTSLLTDDDGEYFCRVLLACDGVRFVPEAKVYYRATGSGSVSYIGRAAGKLESQWRSMQLHISYLRSLEDSPRVRSACVAYMQNWLIHFYPDRPDIIRQAEEMARDLGGQLRVPELSWKYNWINALFGWRWARTAQLVLPQARWALKRSFDKALFRVESHKFRPVWDQ